MTVKFNLGDSSKDIAFYALYSGLKMYQEQEDSKESLFSASAAEAFCMLRELEEQHPLQYSAAKSKYNQTNVIHK